MRPKLSVVRTGLAIFVVGCVLLFGSRVGLADDSWTDANIVTGLDISGSIEARDADIQIDGISQAIRAPEIIAAIQRGHYRRIGFAVFVWADGAYPVLASWSVISSPEDALETSEEVAHRLRAMLDSGIMLRLGALTDVSNAIEYGGEMLRSAPFPTNSRILNIVGNGIDNVGAGPRQARDRLVAQGIVINAVALGYDRAIFEYFHQEVIGGETSFVLRANDPEELVDVLARKFVTEIVFNTGRTELAHAQR